MWSRPEKQKPIEKPKRQVSVVPATWEEHLAVTRQAEIREIVRQVLVENGLIDAAAEDE